jgi:hypothetical protein
LSQKTHDEHKQKQNRTQKKDEHNEPHQKTALNPDTREKLAVSTSYAVTNIDKLKITVLFTNTRITYGL